MKPKFPVPVHHDLGVQFKFKMNDQCDCNNVNGAIAETKDDLHRVDGRNRHKWGM